jgi:hypothetical protein
VANEMAKYRRKLAAASISESVWRGNGIEINNENGIGNEIENVES